VSACQIATECLGCDAAPRLHCAKRSSAALRTALQFETEMKRRRIEGSAIDRASILRLTSPRRQQTADNGIASRVRRDGKNALEQRPHATACGEQPMIAVPILGRAVRLYKSWYALCAYCGALMRVQPHVHRYGAELCCLRCDESMMGRGGARAADTRAEPVIVERQCRFCGVRCDGASAAGWREIKAPLDVAGPNASRPEPLRRVWYCRQHYRGWVAQAHRVMQTRFILAHLVHNAKPLFGADTSGSSEKQARKRPTARKAGGKRRNKR
tara:strand:- start:270 stop:1079 length:810 start_codon:yes stop_codon:yes gene_type:complete